MKRQTKRFNLPFAGVILILFLLAACTTPALVNTAQTQTENNPIPTSPQATTPTSSPTPTPTPVPHYAVEAATEVYTAAQEAINTSESALEQQARMQRWLDYWIQFENRPFAENSQELHWKYIYDDARNPQEVLVLLEVGGDYPNKLFTVPMNAEGFIAYPPTLEGETIEAGLEPLAVSAGAEGQYLAVDEGWLVRKDAAGQVVEKLTQGHWEAVEAYSLDLEKFYTMPPSYEDVVAHPEKYQEAPDFFGDTEAAMEWWNSLTAALGDQRELTPNVFADFFALREPIFTFFSSNVSAETLLADYPAFYFKHDNEIYLVPVFTIAEDDSKRHAGTFAVILYDSSHDGFINNEGLEEVENLYEGRKIRAVSGIRQPGRYILPDDVKKFVASEYNWAGLEAYAQTGVGYLIGVGVIGTISD